MVRIMTPEDAEGLVAGKRVAVVGNALSFHAQQLGSLVDMAEVVIRMNRGLPGKTLHRALGRRTTILAGFSFQTEEEWARANRPAVWFRDPQGLAPVDPLVAWAGARVWDYLGLWEGGDLKEAGLERASTGTRILEILTRRMEPLEVRAYGFDWFASPTWYRERDTRTPHDGPAEALFCQKGLGFMPTKGGWIWPPAAYRGVYPDGKGPPV